MLGDVSLVGAYNPEPGWYFRRMPDATVRIIFAPDGKDGPIDYIDIPEDTWASLVALVSKDGGSVATYKTVLHLHNATTTTATTIPYIGN
jgi:hypothetical protein